MEEIMEEVVEQPQDVPEVPEVPEEVTPEEVPTPEDKAPQITAEAQLEAVATVLAIYGGTGQTDTVAEELSQVIDGLLEAHVQEVEESRKAGMLTFALSNLVHDTGAVLALIDLSEVEFDIANVALLRDFLEPIYQEKPYLFKAISPLRGANIATGSLGKTLPTNGELGALSMEEYTAYRNARGSVSR